MIYGRGKWLYGAFVLVARDAARHFASVRGKSPRGRGGSWRPLALRWRRRTKRRENVPAGHAATAGHVFWFPQFHVHYATHRNDRTRLDRIVPLAQAPGVSVARVVVERHWTSVRAGAIPPQAGRADRAWRPFHSPQRSRPRRDAGLTNTPPAFGTSGASTLAPQANRVFRALRHFHSPRSLRHSSDSGLMSPSRWLRSSGSSIEAPAASRLRPLQFGRIPKVACESSPREEGRPFAARSQIWHHWLHNFRMRPPAPGDRVSNSGRENKPLRVEFDRPEELVWRRITRPLTEVAETEHGQKFSDSYERPALRSFHSQEAAGVRAAFEQPTSPQITKLDPSVLDRLTDDVIRRVEQRVRIERERRGL